MAKNPKSKKYVKELRQMILDSNETIEKLAKNGVSKTTISNLRTGKVDDFRFSTFLSLCEGCGILPVEFFSKATKSSLSSEETTMLELFRLLPAGERAKLLSLLKERIVSIA